MDIKIEIEEESRSDDAASQNATEFSHEVTMKRNSDAVLLDNDCNVAIKKEIKSETPFVNQIKFETVICSNNWEIHRKTEIEQQTLVSHFGTENEGEFLPEDPVMKDKKFNSVQETDKMQIKIEPWWLGTEASSGCDEIKDGEFPPAKSSRLCTEVISEANSHKSLLPSAEVSGRDSSFNNEKDPLECERQKGDVTEMPTAEDVFSEQSGGGPLKKIKVDPMLETVKEMLHEVGGLPNPPDGDSEDTLGEMELLPVGQPHGALTEETNRSQYSVSMLRAPMPPALSSMHHPGNTSQGGNNNCAKPVVEIITEALRTSSATAESLPRRTTPSWFRRRRLSILGKWGNGLEQLYQAKIEAVVTAQREATEKHLLRWQVHLWRQEELLWKQELHKSLLQQEQLKEEISKVRLRRERMAE